ncbi:MAG: tetratricopeptide repeat-containing sensor histidine kinase, partial [Bacteroidales bacterium]|nr:tetratricopeptide repeat-containing sensor histidine kinase [Bacteroidales bacterium]
DTTFYNMALECDSILNVYKKNYGIDAFYLGNSISVANAFSTTDPIKTLKILEENIAAAEELGEIELLVFNQHELARFYFESLNLEKASEYYLKSADNYRHIKDYAAYGYSLVDLGNLYFVSRQFNVSKYYYNKALEIFRKYLKGSDLNYAEALIANNYGLIHFELKEYDEALEYFYRAFNFRKKSVRKNMYPHSYEYFIDVHEALGNKDSVIFYFNESLRIQEQLALFEDMANTLVKIGAYYYREDSLKNAISYLNRGKRLVETYEYHSFKSQIYWYLGLVYEKLKSDSAWFYFNLTYTTAIKYQHFEFEKISLEKMIQFHSNSSSDTVLISLYDKYLHLLEKTEIKTLRNYEVELQLKERKREDAFNQKLADRNKAVISLQRLGIFMLVLLLFVISFFILRLRSQKRHLVETISNRDITYSIIGHDLRGPLTSVFQVLQLVDSGMVDDEESRKRALYTSIKTLDNSINLLENLLIWANFQTNRQTEIKRLFLLPLVKQNIQLLENQASAKNIIFDLDVNDEHCLKADENMMSAIIRNLLNNAIKFSEHGKVVKIKSIESVNDLRLIIQDQGVGIAAEKIVEIFHNRKMISSAGTDKEKGSGLGLKIVSEFIKKNGGEIQINSKLGEGTEMILIFKKK